MPGFDGTGPRGMGPMTGGVRGRCKPNFSCVRPPLMGAYPYGSPHGDAPPYSAGYSAPYLAYQYGPHGFGRGFGGGRGFGPGRGSARGRRWW